MGLDTSHGAFHASYSAFNRFRQAVAEAVGGNFPPHGDPSLDDDSWYWPDEGYGPATHPGLHEFFNHSDCDGEISPEDCKRLADELEPLMPRLEEMGEGAGHIQGRGGYAAVLRQFIAGCRAAHAAAESLEFH